ncbi:MAG TPA: 50S ribosomal protein L11 methyltransferase, partial [Trueperaceae bacterium]|nr:50S ribosomal protein L11 methyltransferase [Trueperaceae bacterium]
MVNVYRLQGADGESAEAAALWELGCQGLVEETTADGVPVLLAYFLDPIDLAFGGTWEMRPEVDHIAEYQANLAPVRIGNLVVAPSHAVVAATDGDNIIWLDPGSAFGTGHHETTAMALAALLATPGGLTGKSVLDVGSGTGLLAIVADRLGAESTYGVDVDPLTVPVAR